MTSFYQRTFATTSRKYLTLDQAIGRHQMVADVMASVAPERLAMMTQVWQGITGAPVASGDRTVVHDSVEITCLPEHATVLQRSESVPAAFAFCAVAEALNGINPSDDVGMRKAMARAWDAFEQRRIAANNVREGFGCDESPSWHTLRDIEEAPNSAALRKKIEDIAKLAGQMFEALKHMQTKVQSDDPHRVVGATVGGKVERLMPSELGRLDGPTHDMQTMKILRDQAQVRDMKGETVKERGPMVLLRDESGSMHEEQTAGRGRNTWAAACCIALTRIAWAENRIVRCVHFASAVELQDVPKGDQRAMFEMARSFLGGGTSFASGLSNAYAQVGDLAAHGHKGADVVCMTDGSEGGRRMQEQRVQMNATLDQMEAEGIKLWTIGIGRHHDAEFPMRKRAEKWIFAHDRDIGSVDATAGIVAGLADAAKANDSEAN